MNGLLRNITLLASVLVVLTASNASAEQTGRYVLQRSGEGFIRLDTFTGSTAHCKQRNAAWQCESIDDEQTAADSSISALKAENRKLKARVEHLEKQLADKKAIGRDRLGLPSDEEFDRIMGFFETAMRRFMEFARTLRDFSGEDA